MRGRKKPCGRIRKGRAEGSFRDSLAGSLMEATTYEFRRMRRTRPGTVGLCCWPGGKTESGRVKA